MRGEMYVTWLVQRSPLARAIANEVPHPGYDDVIDELRDPDHLTQAGPAFATIAEKLRKALDFRALRPLGRGDLELLARGQVWSALGPVLKCAPHDVLVLLFDPVSMQRALSEAGFACPMTLDSQKIFLSMLHLGKGPTAIAHHWFVSDNDWGIFMEARGWILPGAEQRLQEEAARRGWSKGSVPTAPTEVLAAIIDESTKPPAWRVGPMEDQFGPLAIVALRRRIAHLVEELRTEAAEQAKLAAELVPADPGPAFLPAWINLYERKAVPPALLSLPRHGMPLRELLSGQETEPMPVRAHPDPDELLAVRAERFQAGRFKKKPYVTFNILCLLTDSTEPQVILRVTKIPPEIFEIVRPRIESLHGRDLAGSDDEGPLGERLLATIVDRPDRLREYLRGVVKRHHSALAQTIVLCGRERPLTAAVPWEADLLGELSFGKRDTNRDVSFPIGLNDTINSDGDLESTGIVNRMRAKCIKDGKDPKTAS